MGENGEGFAGTIIKDTCSITRAGRERWGKKAENCNFIEQQ